MTRKHRTNKDKQIREREPRLADGIGLPRDISCGAAIITVSGRRELGLENYKGIVSYDDTCICIQTRDCKVTVSGCRLKVDYYTNEEMKIVGLIHQICYEV